MNNRITISMLLLAGCGIDQASPQQDFRVAPACPPGCVCVCEDPTGTDTVASSGSDTDMPSTGDPGGSSDSSDPSSSDGSSSEGSADDGSSGGGSADDGGSSGGSADDGSTGGDSPSFDCPVIVDGLNTFCGEGLPCREALIMTYGQDGPLAVYWHGTGETIEGVRPWGAPASIEQMTIAEGGIFVMPEADPDAMSRPNGNIFPWWINGDQAAPEEETDRPDDFLLMDAIVSCLEGQYDPARINTAGFSAGGVLSSYMIAERDDLAGAAIWSGGIADGAPMTPGSPNTSAIVLHGGFTDQYCAAGEEVCYSFVEPSEALAADMVAAGNFAFLCDHGEGDEEPITARHTDSMGNIGAAFLGDANTAGHPWIDYPFGPSAPNGSSWMLDNYCYSSGDPSPWAE